MRNTSDRRLGNIQLTFVAVDSAGTQYVAGDFLEAEAGARADYSTTSFCIEDTVTNGCQLRFRPPACSQIVDFRLSKVEAREQFCLY